MNKRIAGFFVRHILPACIAPAPEYACQQERQVVLTSNQKVKNASQAGNDATILF